MSFFPMILLEPTGGICNRLRAIVSAQKLARDCGSSLTLLWRRDRHLGARFEDLFVKPQGISTVLTVRRDSLYVVLNALLCRLFRNRLEQSDVEAMNREKADFTVYSAEKNIFIRTYSRFHCASDFSLIQPQPDIMRAVDCYRIDRLPVVGVHIRRTDNTRSIAYSPTELFVEAMRSELEKDSGVSFFVSTDSPEDERQLLKTFPGRIILHPKSILDRNKPQAGRDALIDLYCLSRCRKLIGSYWSSFTRTAAEIGGMPTLIVKKQ